MGAIKICKRIFLQAYRNKTLFILLVVPVIGFLIASLLSMPDEGLVHIGILDEDKSSLSASLIRMIEKNESFYIDAGITDVSNMKDKLENQDIVIGMRINKGLYDNIEVSGAIQLFQTYDIETFKLVELYLNSSIDNIILLKKVALSQDELVAGLDKYNADEDIKINKLTNEWSKGLFSSAAFGFLTMFMLLVSVLSSKLIADDRFDMTIKRIFLSPIRRISYLLAGFFCNFIFQLIQVAVIITICLVTGVEFTAPFDVVACVFVLFSVFASFFGLLIGFISKTVSQMLIISQMFMLPGMLLCGTFFEFELLPDWLQKISYIFPQTLASQTVTNYDGNLFSSYFAYLSGYIAILSVAIGAYLLIIFNKKQMDSFY